MGKAWLMTIPAKISGTPEMMMNRRTKVTMKTRWVIKRTYGMVKIRVSLTWKNVGMMNRTAWLVNGTDYDIEWNKCSSILETEFVNGKGRYKMEQ